MPEPRVNLHVVGSTHGIDRAVPAGDRAELRLCGPLLHLVGPVDALLVAAFSVEHAELAADVRHVAVGESTHECA